MCELRDYKICALFIGKVFPPSDGTSLVFARGSTERIVWSYDDEIEGLSRRIWSFESSDGKLDEIFAFVDADGGVNMLTSLFEVAIEKPATLVLRNINETYGGTYKFSPAPSNGGVESEVVVSIAGNCFQESCKFRFFQNSFPSTIFGLNIGMAKSSRQIYKSI